MRCNRFVRSGIHEDSLWVDEYNRFWIVLKLSHFLIEVNNETWKEYFLDHRITLCGKGYRLFSSIIRMFENMCNDFKWHEDYDG